MSNAADEKTLAANPANNQGDPPPATPTITIDSSGNPSGAVTINPGGVVKFDVTYPPNMNVCTIPFGTITFSYQAGPTATNSGTIKVGS
jgi:hypothetical protein